MKLFYFNRFANFGDSINPWFWKQYIDTPFSDDCDQLLVGIGTLINNLLPEDYREIHVLGSGAGYGHFIPKKRENWHIHCVRGPLTAKALEIDDKYAITDPAILLNELTTIGTNRNMNCGFMPHIGIDSPRLKETVEECGILYISPGDEPAKVIEEVNRCERLICSAMHGAILADALRVPWYPVSTSNEILPFKWQDWLSSMQIEKELHQLITIWPHLSPGIKGSISNPTKKILFRLQLKKIQKTGKFILSEQRVFDQRKSQLKDVFFDFNKINK